MRAALWSCLALGYGAKRGLRNLTIATTFLATPALAEPLTLVALGDSLTEGYGLPPEDGFVPQLQGWLDANGAEVQVLNAGVSGDTTAGGLSRLDWTLTPEVDALIVSLGGNDVLRGLPPEESRANLDAILAATAMRGLPVMLVAMTAPGNYGPDYKADFDAIYPDLAKQYGALLAPGFFAILLADNPDPAALGAYLQPDGLHPNKAGVTRIVEGLGPQALELLAGVKE